jgi:hypothetical protein
VRDPVSTSTEREAAVAVFGGLCGQLATSASACEGAAPVVMREVSGAVVFGVLLVLVILCALGKC